MKDDKDDDRTRWRFKREVSSGDILLALSVVLPMLWYVARLDGRVNAVEERQATQIATQQRIDAAQDAALRESVYRIEASVRDVQAFLLNNSAMRAPSSATTPAPPR